MKAKDFDAKFDQDAEDIIDDLDVTTARRVNQEPKPSHEAANKKLQDDTTSRAN